MPAKGMGIRMRRRLFGLHSGDVEALLAERDSALRACGNRVAELETQAIRAAREASEAGIESGRRLARAEAAERKLASAGAEFVALRQTISSQEREIETLRRQSSDQLGELQKVRLELEEIRNAALQSEPVEDLTFRYLMEEIGPILRGAEESAARIEDAARVRVEAREADLARLEDELRAQAVAFAERRRTVEPVLAAIAARIEDVDQRMRHAPGLVAHALEPLAEAMSSMRTELQQSEGVLVLSDERGGAASPAVVVDNPVRDEPELQSGEVGVDSFLAHANPWRGRTETSPPPPNGPPATEGIVAVLEEGPEGEGGEGPGSGDSVQRYVIEVEVDSAQPADRPT